MADRHNGAFFRGKPINDIDADTLRDTIVELFGMIQERDVREIARAKAIYRKRNSDA